MFKFFLKRINNKKGFTLVELIVVIAILGILAAIAVPKLGGFKQKAAEKADKATAATIGNTVALYYSDIKISKDKDIDKDINITIKKAEGSNGEDRDMVIIEPEDNDAAKNIYKMLVDANGNLPTPQSSDKKYFVAVVDEGGGVKVYYVDSENDDTKTLLWPESEVND